MKQESLFGDEPPPRPRSAFDEAGIRPTIRALLDDMTELYRCGSSPWVVGYSGGKDSTAALQLVWTMLSGLSPDQRTRPVHVISTDTRVENPIVVAWVNRSVEAMRGAAQEQGLPITPHRLRPPAENSFWTNLIGRGYPAPRPMFRWCTDRLKIQPSTAFLKDLTSRGEVILVLGTRKAESVARARTMEKREKGRIRDRLSPNAAQPGSYIYSPIEDWSNDDVWVYLMQFSNPWGHHNRELLGLYQGASEGGECPLVVDKSTPSCGASRFGCWVCTMVEQDKSMTAMVTNDDTNAWMRPLLELRNELDAEDDRHLRDHRRMNGLVQLHKGRLVHGPYTAEARAMWSRKVLNVQTQVRGMAPSEFKGIELIALDEIEEIRRLWVVEKNEVEDILPELYQEATRQPYPGRPLGDAFDADTLALLRECCGGDEDKYLLLRDLLATARKHATPEKRSGMAKDLGRVLLRHSHADQERALQIATERAALRGPVDAMPTDDRQASLFDDPSPDSARMTP